MHMVEKLE